MIIVRLMGGLGNQLFAYAAGRALALRRGTTLKLDLSWFPLQNLRKYELGGFRLPQSFASPREIRKYRKRDRVLNWLFQTAWGCLPKGTCRAFREKRYYVYDADIINLPADAYLDGYWQNEAYFREYASEIRRDLQLVHDPDTANKATLQKIRAGNAVSLHVRRGDFIASSRIHSFHGVCSTEYYAGAVRRMSAQVRDPRFFVFSDEPDWVRQNLALPAETTFVTHNGTDRGQEDLRLMAACRHHIIANSSFSWWGAWLGENPAKCVIAPRQWVKASGVDCSTVYPEGWVTI